MSKQNGSTARSRMLRITGAVGAGVMVLGMVTVGAAVADSGSGDRTSWSAPKPNKSREARVALAKPNRSREARIALAKPNRSREARVELAKPNRSREARIALAKPNRSREARVELAKPYRSREAVTAD